MNAKILTIPLLAFAGSVTAYLFVGTAEVDRPAEQRLLPSNVTRKDSELQHKEGEAEMKAHAPQSVTNIEFAKPKDANEGVSSLRATSIDSLYSEGTEEMVRSELLRLGHLSASPGGHKQAIMEILALPHTFGPSARAAAIGIFTTPDATGRIAADTFAPDFADALAAHLRELPGAELGRDLHSAWSVASESPELRTRIESLDIPSFHAECAATAAKQGDTATVMERLARLETSVHSSSLGALISLGAVNNVPYDELAETVMNWAANTNLSEETAKSMLSDHRLSARQHTLAGIALAVSGEPTEAVAALEKSSRYIAADAAPKLENALDIARTRLAGQFGEKNAPATLSY